MNDRDSLRRFVFEDSSVRGELVYLDATWQAVLARRDYPPSVRALLGEAMAAAVLLSATIKFTGSFTLQIQGDGPVYLLVVQCTSERTLRGLARWKGSVSDGPLDEMFGGGRLAITIDPGQAKERYQGIVELGSGRIQDALEDYFRRSEQLATHLWLAADANRAVGMLLQNLPGENADQDAWGRVVHLGKTLTDAELLELPAREILHRLFHEEDVRLFGREPVSFRCGCSREAIEDILRRLGYDEVRDILREQGRVKVDCEFCGQHYEFDPVDARQVFAAAVPPTVPKTRH